MLGVSQGFLLEGIVGFYEIAVTVSYYLIGIHVLVALYHRLLRDHVSSATVPFLWEQMAVYALSKKAQSYE